MTIMRIGEFELRNITYIDNRVPTTHNLEIVKWEERNGHNYCYTIATFNERGEIVSCMDRLFKAINIDENSEAAILAISGMAEVASTIINCSNPVPIYSAE